MTKTCIYLGVCRYCILISFLHQVIAQYGALVGTEKTLECPNGAAATWTFNGQIIVENGEVKENYTDRFNVSVDPSFMTSYLTVISVGVEDAGQYRACCSSYPYMYECSPTLTVLVSSLHGDQDQQFVVADDNLTITCYANYVGPTQPSLQWTDSDQQIIDTFSQWIGTDNTTEYSVDVNVLASSISVSVPSDVDSVPSYMCTLTNLAMDEVMTWNSSQTVISYCPKDVHISEQDEEFTINSSLSCSSNAFPQPTYEWQVIQGHGYRNITNDDMFVITSAGFFNITCTPTNLLKPPHQFCTAHSAQSFDRICRCSATRRVRDISYQIPV